MLDESCLFAPCAVAPVRESWRQKLLQELWRLQEPNDPGDTGPALGWIQHARACTLKNMCLSQSCLVLVLQGKKALLSGDVRSGEVLTGGAVFIPAGEGISCINTPGEDGGYCAVTVSFDAPLLDRVRQRLAPPKGGPGEGAGDAPGKKAVRDITPLLECVYTFLRLLPVGDDPMLPCMQQEQMIYILWKLGVPVFNGPQGLVGEIRAMVEAAPQNSWSPSELAERLFMTERTLRRHLGDLGTSPSELVRVSRLHCGLGMLLRERVRIHEVASYCGYSSPSRFAARFRELFGITPAKVLSSHRKNRH